MFILERRHMQRNKYLDQLGISINKYGTNFCNDSDDRRQKLWKEQREIYGFDSRECWNLDRSFIEWLYSHLMMYTDQACIDMDIHKIEFSGATYTQKEAINYILERLKAFLAAEGFDNDDIADDVYEAIKMWAEIFQLMWW